MVIERHYDGPLSHKSGDYSRFGAISQDGTRSRYGTSRVTIRASPVKACYSVQILSAFLRHGYKSAPEKKEISFCSMSLPSSLSRPALSDVSFSRNIAQSFL